MSEVINPPEYYFPNIDFNPAFYALDTGGLSQETANALYLQKTVPDTATALETFTAGIKTLSISSTGTGASNILNVGIQSRTVSGAVHHYSDGDNCVAGAGVHLNNGINNNSHTNIHNGTGANATGAVNIMSGTSNSGTITIGNETTNNTTSSLRGNTTVTKLTLTAPITSAYTVVPIDGQIGYYPAAIFNPTDPLLLSDPGTPGAFANTSIAKIPLTAGTWILAGSFEAATNVNAGYVICAITPNRDAWSFATDYYVQSANSATIGLGFLATRIVQVTASTNYFLTVRTNVAGQTIRYYKFSATRVA